MGAKPNMINSQLHSLNPCLFYLKLTDYMDEPIDKKSALILLSWTS